MAISPFGASRTHGAGTLDTNHDGQEVVLAGWVDTRRDHGGKAFLDLRDRSGICQVVADPDVSQAALETVHTVRTEWVVQVRGVVRRRPEGMENPALTTGEVEVVAEHVEVLSAAETPPFPIEDGVAVDETLRLRHRYLDLRRPEMLAALRTRAQVTRIIREVMDRNGFIEVETPILTRPTPEGARDYLVPSRVQPGTSYALPQSPQLYKQLLMVAGVERYYQIARCFRDEDLRADRQYEFTQLDLELSFGDEEDVYALVEELMVEIWREVLDTELPTPFPRLTYAESMARFGTDKPDLRFGMELATLDDVFEGTDVGVFRGVLDAGGSVVATPAPGGGDMTRREFDGWVDWAKARGARGLAWGVVEADDRGEPGLRSPLAKFMREDEIRGVIDKVGLEVGDAVFFSAGPTGFARELAGSLRLALAHDRGLVPSGEWRFCWITEPPMFDPDGEGGWTPNHHPFTSPAPEFVDGFEDHPGAATTRAYDIVLNGVELASGSVRIHDADLQRRVFAFLGLTDDEIEAKFGFLLRGFGYGVPPHCGIAPGLDRLVMLIAGRPSIREVIAFPKTPTGDPMTDAPAPLDDLSLRELGLGLRRSRPTAPDSTPPAG